MSHCTTISYVMFLLLPSGNFFYGLISGASIFLAGLVGNLTTLFTTINMTHRPQPTLFFHRSTWLFPQKSSVFRLSGAQRSSFLFVLVFASHAVSASITWSISCNSFVFSTSWELAKMKRHLLWGYFAEKQDLEVVKVVECWI